MAVVSMATGTVACSAAIAANLPLVAADDRACLRCKDRLEHAESLDAVDEVWVDVAAVQLCVQRMIGEFFRVEIALDGIHGDSASIG